MSHLRNLYKLGLDYLAICKIIVGIIFGSSLALLVTTFKIFYTKQGTVKFYGFWRLLMAVQFKHIMLMVKDIPATVKFYNEGLGIKVIKSSPGWAELDADGTTIALHAASENGQSGSSPILSFHVDDVYETIATLEKMNATLEGNVREPSFGKVAAMRTPDGSIISLLQPNTVPASSH